MNTNTPAWATGSTAYANYLAAARRCDQAFGRRPAFRTWTSSNGQRRRYITNVAAIIGFTYDGHGLKVRAGRLDGELLSNTDTYKNLQLIETAGFWVDDQRNLHYRGVEETRQLDVETIADAINATRTR